MVSRTWFACAKEFNCNGLKKKSESVSHSVMSNSLRPHGLCRPPGFSVHGILQARILEWVAIPFSGDLPNPGIKPRSPALQAGSLLFEPPSGGSVMIKRQILEKGRRVAWGEDGACECSFEMGKVFLQNLGVLALRDLA